MNNSTIITVAPTGGILKKDTPHVPSTAEEIVDCICECYEAGATVAHIHARDKHGNKTNDSDVYADIIERIRRNGCPIICQVSLAGNAVVDESLLNAMDCKPRMISFMPGSVNYENRLNNFEPAFIEKILNKANELNILPEAEIVDLNMINRARQLVNKGLLAKNTRYNLVLNAQGILEGN